MNRKLFSILRHAVTMVRRNLRSYGMLSVTIVISFSLLLGYLVLMDSNHYSKHKELFAQDRHIVTAHSKTDTPISMSMAELMQDKASEYGDTHSTQILQTSLVLNLDELRLETGERLIYDLFISAYCLPRQAWYLSDGVNPISVTWLDGKEHPNYDLKSGEILMDEQLYYALGLDKADGLVELDLQGDNWKTGELSIKLSREFRVVGVIPSNWKPEICVDKLPNTGEPIAWIEGNGTPNMVLSLEDMNPAAFPDGHWRRTVAFYTDSPESVKAMLQRMDPSLNVNAVYEYQNAALTEIQTEKATKALVAAILLLLLGINLYSSFDNALNDRKFEIGVKRAVGASAFTIVRQFFYEGLVVMVVDVLLSVAIVADLAVVYKFIRDTVPNEYGYLEHYVLHITPYSVAIYLICALVLTVVFSLVFAYKSTQVQVVDYLKAE